MELVKYIAKEEQKILDDLVIAVKQECLEAKTPNDLNIIQAKYLGKNSVIVRMEKENAEWYKAQKQKEKTC